MHVAARRSRLWRSGSKGQGGASVEERLDDGGGRVRIALDDPDIADREEDDLPPAGIVA
jgi:hypothetical protein